MKIAFFINDFETLLPRQTTWAIIARAQEMGHEIAVVPVHTLSTTHGGAVVARCRTDLRATEDSFVDLSTMDLVLFRTNPARDPRGTDTHDAALVTGALLEDHGVTVLNRPSGLWRASTKSYLSSLPADTVPAFVVSCDERALMDFVAEQDGPTVLKPVKGTRGQDVFAVQGTDAPNLKQIVASLTRHGAVMAQAWAKGAEAGDTRVLVVGGEPLVLNGRICAVSRTPPKGDFRSNVHVGGTASAATMTENIRKTVEKVGPVLVKHGIEVAGIDLIGDRVIEANVFSPGGMIDAMKNTGEDFIGHLLEHCLSKTA